MDASQPEEGGVETTASLEFLGIWDASEGICELCLPFECDLSFSHVTVGARLQ